MGATQSSETDTTTMDTVAEIDQIERLERLAERYEKGFGAPPFNVSHWDPSPDVSARLLPLVKYDIATDPLDYVYSYTLDAHEEVLRRLGFDPQVKRCLFTPSGTASMLCAVNWLRLRGVRRLTAYGPFYFPVLYQCNARGIGVDIRYMVRACASYELPARSAEQNMWITNPVYCTGVRCSDSSIEDISDALIAGSHAVIDETLASSGQQIATVLPPRTEVVSIHAPHKSVSVNGLKFSVVVFDGKYDASFNQWADVLYGPLNIATNVAVKHYLSEHFEEFEKAFQLEIRRTLQFVRRQVDAVDALELDRAARGHFVTIYAPQVRASLGEDEDFLWTLLSDTATLILPSTRNHFDPEQGFCFRVNLARDCAQFRASIARVVRWLGAQPRSRSL